MLPPTSRQPAVVLFLVLAGCGDTNTAGPTAPPGAGGGSSRGQSPGDEPRGTGRRERVRRQKVRTADYSILFVGNSHTTMYDMPNLVCKMIRFRHPMKTTYSHTIPVAFLEDLARNPRSREEVEKRSWKYVVLQAQKISVSGKHNYSRTEGIDFAKFAKTRGAAVYFSPSGNSRTSRATGRGAESIRGDGT